MIKMANILKQFAAWATSFKSNSFLRARLKLTAYYTAVVLVILAVFSLAVYGLFARNIASNLEYEGSGQEENSKIEAKIIEKAQDQMQTILLTVDGLIIVLVAGLSYYLAGKTLEPIETAYKRQKRFVADCAHELRTPLAVMKTGVEAVLNGRDSKDEYKKLTQDSLEELNHLSVTVDDLLFLARSDDLQKVEFNKFDLANLARKQIELMRPYAQDKAVDLQEDIKGELHMDGNKVYLKRLLSNLVKNAIDYNKPKGTVKVTLQKDKQQAVLKVTDTGIGISQEDLKHIFERFYKSDKARVRKSSGAGLGLSIVQEIVALHKGKIDIKSELDKGTEIIVSLPFASS